DSGIDASSVRGRGVWSHTAPRRAYRRRLCRQPFGGAQDKLVEARERLGAAIDVEVLLAFDAAIGPEHPELEKLPLERSAACAFGPRGRPADKGYLGSQAKDVIDTGDDVVGDVEERVQPIEVGCGAARRPDSDDAAMVDELEGRGHRGGVAIEVKRSGH